MIALAFGTHLWSCVSNAVIVSPCPTSCVYIDPPPLHTHAIARPLCVFFLLRSFFFSLSLYFLFFSFFLTVQLRWIARLTLTFFLGNAQRQRRLRALRERNCRRASPAAVLFLLCARGEPTTGQRVGSRAWRRPKVHPRARVILGNPRLLPLSSPPLPRQDSASIESSFLRRGGDDNYGIVIVGSIVVARVTHIFGRYSLL